MKPDSLVSRFHAAMSKANGLQIAVPAPCSDCPPAARNDDSVAALPRSTLPRSTRHKREAVYPPRYYWSYRLRKAGGGRKRPRDWAAIAEFASGLEVFQRQAHLACRAIGC
jgi:hypothetical protein